MSKSRSSSIVSILNQDLSETVEEDSESIFDEIPLKLAVGAETRTESKNSNNAKVIPFKREFGDDDPLKKKALKDGSDDSSSEFLIQERLKSRVSRFKLQEGEAKKLYQAGANLEFCEPENEGELSKAVDPKGVLYNKKHP